LEELGEALREANTTPTNELVLELSWRKDDWCLLLVNVISKTAKFVLNLPEMIMSLDCHAVYRPLACEDTEKDG
jgi:hypothetical protein